MNQPSTFHKEFKLRGTFTQFSNPQYFCGLWYAQAEFNNIFSSINNTTINVFNQIYTYFYIKGQLSMWMLLWIKYPLDILKPWYFTIFISPFIHFYHFIILPWTLKYFSNCFNNEFLRLFKNDLFSCSIIKVKLQFGIQIKKSISQKHLPPKHPPVASEKNCTVKRKETTTPEHVLFISSNPKILPITLLIRLWKMDDTCKA